MFKVFLFLMFLNIALGQTDEQLAAMPPEVREYVELLRSREVEPAQSLAQQLTALPEEMRVLLADHMMLLESPESVKGVLLAAHDVGVMTKTVSPFLFEILSALDTSKVCVRVMSETPFELEGVETNTRRMMGVETLVFVNDDFLLVGGFLDNTGPTVWVSQSAPGLESVGTFDLLWSDN